jgi:hypothetical protein
MNTGIVFNQSAFKHNISEDNIRYAFAHAVVDHPIEGEEDKHLLIGFDRNANLLEILYNVLGDQKINVFHAMKCRKAWRSIANM